jgi:hypothetical protein
MKMAKKNVLTKNALNENYARLARDVINSAVEALGGTTKSRDKYAKACGFSDGEADALAFFKTDWAERLIDLSLGFIEPDTLIGRWLSEAYGRPIDVEEIPNARKITGPHLRKTTNEHAIKIGGRKRGLEIKLDCI